MHTKKEGNKGKRAKRQLPKGVGKPIGLTIDPSRIAKAARTAISDPKAAVVSAVVRNHFVPIGRSLKEGRQVAQASRVLRRKADARTKDGLETVEALAERLKHRWALPDGGPLDPRWMEAVHRTNEVVLRPADSKGPSSESRM